MTLKIGGPVISLLRVAYAANVPVMLSGAHGIGKSEIVKTAAAALGVDCTVIDLSLCEPPDLVGLPVIVGSTTRFAPPAQLPREGKGLFVIEELNRAPVYMRRPCLQLLTERRLNEYELPPGWLPIACINPANDATGYDVDQIDPALRSRFLVADVAPSVTEWIGWAKHTQIHPAIVSFVQSAGDDALSGAEVQPRAWSYASKFVRAFELENQAQATLEVGLAGLLGDKWAVAFLRSYQGTEQPLTAEEILTGDESVTGRIRRWHRTKRVDLLTKSLQALEHHLQTNVVARRTLGCEDQRRAVTTFIRALPGDQKRQAGTHLDKLCDQFGAPPLPWRTK